MTTPTMDATSLPNNVPSSGVNNSVATTNTIKSLVPNKEAVAALSATLAFRRFENQQHQHCAEAENDDVGALALPPDFLVSSSIDPMEDSLRRLSGILNASFALNGMNGSQLSGRRRASLETILSEPEGRGGSFRGSGMSSSGGSGLGVELQELSSSLLQQNSKVVPIDDRSLDSNDLQQLDENKEDQGNEGSMTISQLEDKLALQDHPNYKRYLLEPADNDDSDDDDGEGHNESVDILKEDENADNVSSAKKGFINSLQKIFDSSQNSRGSRGRAKSKSKAPSSNNSSLNASNSVSSKNQWRPPNESSNSYQAWRKRFNPSSSKGNNNNSHNNSSHDNSLSWREKLETRLEGKKHSSNTTHNNEQNNSRTIKDSRDKFNHNRKNINHNSRNNSGSNSNNDIHNAITNNRKEISNLSANLSGCLKPSSSSTLSQQISSIVQQHHPRSMTYNPKPNSKKSRVSWKLDAEDVDFNFSTNSKPPSEFVDSTITNSGSHFASLTLSTLGNSACTPHVETNTYPHPSNAQPARSHSLASEGSIDLESVMAETSAAVALATASDRNNGTANASLAADEELLMSMIKLAYDSKDLTSTGMSGVEGRQQSDSSWEAHYDVSAGSGLNQSLNRGLDNVLPSNIPEQKGDCSAAVIADGETDKIVGGNGDVNASSVVDDDNGSDHAQHKNKTPNEITIQKDTMPTTIGKEEEKEEEGRGKQQSASTVPVDPEHLRELVRRTSCSTTTVTRLAHQEVEDYRTRLKRKRASMMEHANASTAPTHTPSSREESQHLNELLFHNATTISNAVLLQRALYTLRINNNDMNIRHPGAGGPVKGGNTRGSADTMGRSDESLSSNAIEERTASSSFGPRAHSEHTGLDRMALNHFLTISSSASNNRSGDPANNNNNANAANAPSANADWNIRNTTRNSSQLPTSASELSPGTTNPYTSLVNHGRTTNQERARNSNSSAPSTNNTASVAPEIGAIQSNEPAPLLFERTFSTSGQNRRARRAEARRHTLLALERDRQQSSALAEHQSSSIAEDDDSDSSVPRRRRNNTARRVFSVNDVNFNDSSGCVTTGNIPARGDPVIQDSDEDDTTDTTVGSSAVTVPIASGTSTRDREDLPVANCAHCASNANANNDTSRNNTNLIASQGSRQSDDHNDNVSLSNSITQRSIRDLFRASVRRQSFRIFDSARLLQAILVSDEIVEADHVETIPHSDNNTPSPSPQYSEGSDGDIENGSIPSSIRQRLEAMEDLLEEQEDEQRYLLEKYRQREKIFAVAMVLSAGIIIALVIIVIVT